jgi:glycosyltransferase involved in cell wall biosynthesis
MGFAAHRMTIVNACTIVSRRDLSRARVLAATLREHEPDVRLTVLLLDTDPKSAGAIEHAHLLGLEDLVGEAAGLLAAANPPGALAMVALPHLAHALLEDGADALIYLGAGQRVLGSLEELTELLSSHQIVLIARSVVGSSSAAGDGAAFAADSSYGAFSRELIALRDGPATSALLAAWPRYFASGDDDGAAAVSAWLDGIPAISEDVAVLRSPGYGLDPLTLARRPTAGDNDVLRVAGQPARVLDLGELDPEDPPACFKGSDRIHLSATPALAELVIRHAEELLSAGYREDSRYPPTFCRLEDGTRLTPTLRALLVKALGEGAVSGSPFTEEGRKELYEYSNQPGDRGRAAGLTRLHMAIWEAREDLKSGYPHIDGPDGAGFAGWLCRYGGEEEGLGSALLPPAPELSFRDANPHVHEQEQRWGVNVAGFFTAELGVGEAARLLIAGLDAAEIPALPIQGHLAPPSRQEAQFSHARPDEAAYPINIMCINGDGIPLFAREAGRSFFQGRYTIALWWWEAGDPPAEWTPAYEFIDEVWAATQHIYDAIAPTSPVPVVRMTLPVLTPEVAPRSRKDLGFPEQGFTFLYLHDYHSVAARKNPTGLIEAFRRAFPPGSGAKLVLKSINADTRPDEHDRILLAVGEHPDITLIDGYVLGSEKNAMIANCDCYVSLHRSEGFGLTVAEAMLLAKPVIATRYGGTQEFLNEENAYLVDWEPTRIGEGAFPYPSDGVWAEPDLDQAVELMRHVVSEPDEARARGAIARDQMLERHSPQVAGTVIKRRLTLIHERMYEEGARSPNLAHLPTTLDGELVSDRIANAPKLSWGRNRLAAYLKWRLQRPVGDWAVAYAEHQRSIDSEMQDEISRIDARLREVAQTLQDQQQAHHAETLAILRNLQADLADHEKPADNMTTP